MKYSPGESRVVIVNGVDEGTGLGQVLDIVHAPRRIISATSMATGTILEPGKFSVMLEYTDAKYASACVAIQAKYPMMLQDRTSRDYAVDMNLISTKSSEISRINRKIIMNQGTRSLALDLFPISGCWYFLKVIGMKYIIRAEFEPLEFGNASQGRFNIEFASIFEADKTRKMLFRFKNELYHPRALDIKFTDWCISEQTQETKRHLGSASHVPNTLLAERFCTWPYHTWVPGPEPAKESGALKYPTLDFSKVKVGPLEVSYEEISDESSDDEKQVRRQLPERTYRIVGSSCQLTLRKDGFSVPVSDDWKITSAVAISTNNMTDMVEDYFKNSNAFDYRKYDEYGVVVRHRLRVVAETGVPYHLARCNCGGRGCTRIDECPVNEICQEWHAKKLALNAAEAAARERKQYFTYN